MRTTSCKPTFSRATVIQQHGSAPQKRRQTRWRLPIWEGRGVSVEPRRSALGLAGDTCRAWLPQQCSPISNRKYMTIFHSENWAASELRRLSQANSWHNSPRSQSCRKFPWPPWRLIATFAISEIESTCRKQTPKQISNSNKNAFFGSRQILPDALSAYCPLRDATRVTGSSHAGFTP
jgi:hypothetical protein